MDENGIIYNSIFTFKEDVPLEKKWKTSLKGESNAKKKECNRYELLIEECLEMHKLLFCGNLKFDDGHRPIEHSYKKENEKLKCRTLIETNIRGEPKYFHHWIALPEIEIQENQKKREWNTISPKE